VRKYFDTNLRGLLNLKYYFSSEDESYLPGCSSPSANSNSGEHSSKSSSNLWKGKDQLFERIRIGV